MCSLTFGFPKECRGRMPVPSRLFFFFFFFFFRFCNSFIFKIINPAKTPLTPPPFFCRGSLSSMGFGCVFLSPPVFFFFFFFFFFSSLWAWIYKLKNQAKMTLIRSPSFCRKCSCSAGTGFTATICCIFSLTKSISSFNHACSDNAMAPITPLNPGLEKNENTNLP